MFFRKKITLLDGNWKEIKTKSNLTVKPNMGEMIYIDELDKYFRVVNVLHSLYRKHGLFVIVEEMNFKKEKNESKG